MYSDVELVYSQEINNQWKQT